jgi:hypothetical protein
MFISEILKIGKMNVLKPLGGLTCNVKAMSKKKKKNAM